MVQIIFSGEYTKALDQDWHPAHFSCWQCDESLSGQRYVLKDDHPFCVKCYLQAFGNSCVSCGQVIGIDSKDLSYKENHWHENCFSCYKCQAPLLEKPFGCKGDKVYCGNCYEQSYAARCDGCQDPFKPGSKKLEYKGHQWHERCFCCCTCKDTIGTKSFIPRDNSIYCLSCYEDTFATRCVKCNKSITTGGVTYRNDPWHRECFTCSECARPLAGQRFTSREDRPYCSECFGQLFAKRCAACSHAITGIGGTRFISFEERYWHNDCFICGSCNGSLVGRGFIADGSDVLCPECAKQKLL
ncbi:FHL2 [Cordylochernes scorpioides]|uniref:FHL2 n=1 Tax=Cordylochernes scorpioides TaxID=51811 RepID=A0ABY6L4G6_9ARAC|nr:FHL2 [Cordylochernes scorpioides]